MLLTERDLILLQALQTDSRLPNAELAEKAGLSASACWRRLRALEDAGVIERFSVQLSPEKTGLSFQALVHVQLTRHNPEHMQDFIRAIEARPEVMECYATTGQADYHMRVLCPDIAAYNIFLENFLFTLPAVESAQTNVVLREIKRSRQLPLRTVLRG